MARASDHRRWATRFAMLLIGCAASVAARCAVPPAEPAAGIWEQREVAFAYHGITTRYSCDGIEEKVRTVLLKLGARPDLDVRATGCGITPGWPSANAWVTARFKSLVPAPDRGDRMAVAAQWSHLDLRPAHDALENGECELIEQMRQLITTQFRVQHLEYQSRCFPHQISLAAFRITGELLRAVPPEAASATR